MQKMVKFKLSRECREISVNPAQVLYVCHYDNGASSLHFGKDCVVRVQGDVAEVTRIIEAALGSGTGDGAHAEGATFDHTRTGAGIN